MKSNIICKILCSIALGLLLLSSLTAKPYRGAELRTLESYTYGRFEVRYKAAAGAGQTSTFFTYYDGPNAYENWNELDIEILGRYPDDVQFNAITPYQTNHVSHQYVDFNPYTDYHVYVIEWTPDYVTWFIDSDEVYRQTDDHISTLTHPQKIMMNIWPPIYEDWVGALNPDMLPVFAYYDWVQYSSYTPGAGDNGTDNNFTFQWRDDFDAWNQSRWAKGSHTWNGNNSQFTPDNSVFRDGKMILCLTDSIHTGYVDNSAPKIYWIHAENQEVLLEFTEQVDSVTAVDPSNYSIPGKPINSITLLPDQRTVRLILSDTLQAGNRYNVIVFNVKDLPPGGNPLLGANVSFIAQATLEFPIRINVGGNSTNGFLGDSLWNPADDYGYENGSRATISMGWDIANTDDDQVFRDFIKDIAVYRVRVPNGTYQVTLLFSENEHQGANRRVFDVQVESQTIVNDLDIYQEVGNKTALTIIAEHINVSDGRLEVHFSDAHFNPPLLNGIEIIQESVDKTSEINQIPGRFQLYQNYPNPFNGSTTVTYQLPAPGRVRVKVVNLQGEEVSTIVSEQQDAGEHSLLWDAGSLGSGLYLVELVTNNSIGVFRQSQKVLLLK